MMVAGAAACMLVLVLSGQPTSTAAQFIVHSAGSKCPTNRYFLSSLDDVQPAYAPFSGVYIGSEDTTGESVYRHEQGHANLRIYTTENYGNTTRTWYIEADDPPTSIDPAHRVPGAVDEDSTAAPLGYLRSSSVNGADWEVWSDGAWRSADAHLPDGDSRLRLTCVGAAWRCPAGRLHVSGLPADVLTTATLRGSLLGADQPAFSKEHVRDDDPYMTVAAPLPPDVDSESNVPADDTANRVLLGTFLMTNEMHMNRPVYRQAGVGYPTFLYFDRLRTSDTETESQPLWIVGQEPRRVDLDNTRLFVVVDSAARPEEITGQWQHLVAGRQSRAYLNVSCEHGRTPPGPLNGADCDFELPGACSYRAAAGRLSQVAYSADQLDSVGPAGDRDVSPGRFFAQVTSSSDGGKADVLSMPFEAATNSCMTFDYRMRTEAFFRCQFSLVAEEDGARYMLFTMTSAARDWMRIQRDVPAGRYRLHARTNELADTDKLQMDSVSVIPGACGEYTPYSPCSRQPCANGGTCVPTGATTYTCLCQGRFQGRDCRALSPCPSPPEVSHGSAQLVPSPEDALPAARYSCRPGFELKAPLARSVAMCLDGRWRGVPECRPSTDGRGAAGSVSPTGITAAAALVVLAALKPRL